MTLSRAGAPENFSRTADAYQATMAVALAPIAAEVVRRAALTPSEDVLDVGTGTGIGAKAALGAGRRVVGLDAAAGMLRLAREAVPEAEFVEGDFSALPFGDATFDVLIAVHALLFAEDRGATLGEWRRVTRPAGRLSLSVPGPLERSPHVIYGDVYAAHGLNRASDYPSAGDLARLADQAGWDQVAVDADPDTEIRLADEADFRRWLTVGSRGRATRDWPAARVEALNRDLMTSTPRDALGFRIPFGSLYLTARRPA
jgi:SAM-dependent methyltransferase